MLHMHVWSILKLLEYIECLCNVVPIFLFYSNFVQLLQSLSICYICFFPLSYPLEYYPYQLRQRLILHQTIHLQHPVLPLLLSPTHVNLILFCKGFFLLYKYFLPLLFFWVIPLSFSLFFLLSLDSLCILLELTSVLFQVNNHFGFSLGISRKNQITTSRLD